MADKILPGDERMAGVLEGADAKEADFVKRFERRLKRSAQAFEDDRKDWQKFFNTYANDPWDDADKAAMDDEGRPRTSFNYSLGTINAVLGQEQADRKEPRFNGVQGDFLDDFVGDLITRAVRHVYSKCDAYDSEDEMQLDQLVTGYGWCEVFLDVGVFPPRISTAPVDVFEMYPDPDYKRDNGRDMRFVIRARRWPIEDAIARWEDKKSELMALVATSGSGGRIHPEPTTGGAYLMPQPDGDTLDHEDQVWVFDYQFRVKEPWVAYVDPKNGRRLQVPKADFAKISEALQNDDDPETGLPTAPAIDKMEFFKDVYYSSMLAGGNAESAILLSKPSRIEFDWFKYVLATGFKKRNRRTNRTLHFGLAAVIYDPQLWSAKALSSGIENMARSTKQATIVKETLFDDPDEFREHRTKPGATFVAKAEADLQRDIVEIGKPIWQPGYAELVRFALNAVPSTSNVTDANKGTLTTERSNVLISNLQAHAQMVLNPLLQPMSRARGKIAMLVAKLIQAYMPADDFNRVVGDRQLEGVTFEYERDPTTGQVLFDATGKKIKKPILNEATGAPVTPHDLIIDREVFDFTVTVDLGSASATAKEALWRLMTEHAALQELIKDPQIKAILMPLLFRNLPHFPAEQAKEVAGQLERMLQQQETAGTMEGLVAQLQEMPPDALMQVEQVVQQFLAPYVGAAPGAPVDAAEPPQ
jgi:hypothetical protein